MELMDCGGTTPLWLRGPKIKTLRPIAACS
jgi:hypothetical protein